MRQIARAWLSRHFPNWAADTAMRYLPVARFLRRRVREGERGFPWSALNYGVFVILSPLFSLLRPRRAYRTLIFAERRSSP